MSKVIVVNGNDCYKGVTLRYENVISVVKETLGWTQQWGYEPYGDGFVTKLIGYIGGEGVPPTENIGNYVGIDGFVEDISDAVVHSEKGEEGLSAYQVAVNSGFEGTEQEWIASLKQPALDAAETANEAAQNAIDAKEDAITATQNAEEATGLANQSAQDANEKAGLAVTATANAKAATQDAINATENANQSAQDASEKAGLAETATTNANNAAEFANSQRGWTPISVDEEDGLRIIRKVHGYIGGTGDAPVENVGKYFKGDGTFTSNKAEAANYKGDFTSIQLEVDDNMHLIATIN